MLWIYGSELWSDAHMSQTWSIFLSSSLPFPPVWNRILQTPHSNCLSPWYQEPRDWPAWGERQGYFIQVKCKRQTRSDWGTKMHILSFYVRQFNIHTAVILSHVHGKEDLSLFLWVPFDLSPAHKTRIPVQALMCAQHTQPSAQHMYTHFIVLRVCCYFYTDKNRHKHTHNSTHWIPPLQYCQRYIIESG